MAQTHLESLLASILAQLVTNGSVTVAAGDIEIGAVELKNDVDDTRAKIGSGVAANALRAVLATDIGLPAGANLLGAIKDAGPNWTTVWGIAGVPFTSADQHSAVASVSDAPTGGQKLVIDDLLISVDTTMSVTLKEETSGTVIAGPFYLPANSGPVQITPRGKGWKLATADKKLQVITSVAGNIMVQAGYHSEA